MLCSTLCRGWVAGVRVGGRGEAPPPPGGHGRQVVVNTAPHHHCDGLQTALDDGHPQAHHRGARLHRVRHAGVRIHGVCQEETKQVI